MNILTITLIIVFIISFLIGYFVIARPTIEKGYEEFDILRPLVGFMCACIGAGIAGHILINLLKY